MFKQGFDTANRLHRQGVINLPIFEKLTDRQRHDWQLLDELLGHMDRHSRNWMLRCRPDGSFDLALIDNGLCLSELGATLWRDLPAPGQRLDPLNRSRLEQLLATENVWRQKFAPLVGEAAIQHMIKRANKLLKQDHYG